MNATTAYRQVITPDEDHAVVPIPRQWFGRQVEVLFIPVAAEQPALPALPPPNKKTAAFPKFTKKQIEALEKKPHIQRLVGALKSSGLPPDITMAQIREMRLAEKYGV